MGNTKVTLAKDGQEAIQLHSGYRALGRPFGAIIMDLADAGDMGGLVRSL